MQTRTRLRRLPRFRRVRGEIRPFRLTARDLDIIREVAARRFLSSPQIRALTGGPAAQILRRLQLLFHAGYLDRPRAQIDYHRDGGGSRPMVYGLGSRGAGLLRQKSGIPFSRMDRDTKNRSAGRLFLEHTLLTAEILIAVERACREESAGGADVRFVPPEELAEKPPRWTAAAADGSGERAALIPDAVFALDFGAAGDRARQRVICALEADRGTMPVTRRAGSRLSCLSRKLAAYAALWKSGAFERRFGTRRLAVFTVTPSAERAQNIRAAAASLPHGSGLFVTQSLTDGASPAASAAAALLRHCAPLDRQQRLRL